MKTIPYHIPSVVIRQNYNGSYKMRLCIHTNPKFSQRRIQLGLGTHERLKAEITAKIICKVLMFLGLFKKKILKITHEGEDCEIAIIEHSKINSEEFSLPFRKEKINSQCIFSINEKEENAPKIIILNIEETEPEITDQLSQSIIKILGKIGNFLEPSLKVKKISDLLEYTNSNNIKAFKLNN